VHKLSLRRAGVAAPGHTELLGQLSGVPAPVMLLAGPTLKVVPVTAHVPLRAVPDLITESGLRHTLRVTADAFRTFFDTPRPRLAVAGLNPHAGDGGLFGDEEDRVLRPAIEAARREGIEVDGPLPGDSVFHRATTGEFDAVVGMYHDQALIPLKLLDFDHAVNVTLGLPLIRTSVDHGTAYDIAGRGVAAASSMIAALRLAGRMVRSRRAPPSGRA
jgi:4-hydroxythreonine-4-phosphate dehydrogenase